MKTTSGPLRTGPSGRSQARSFLGLLVWCLFGLSCVKTEKHSSPDDLRKLTRRLESVTPIDRTGHRNAQILELLTSQQKAAAAIANSQTPEERDVAMKLYERFSRQIRLREAVFQQMASPGPPKQGKITNGKAAEQGQIPYQAALISTGYPDPYYGQYCGGTVIDQNWVLTAGHCVGGAQPATANSNCRDSALIQTGDVQVFVGSPTLSNSSSGTLVGVSSICVNPNYNLVGLHQDSDVALLRLASPIQVQTFAKIPDQSTQTAMFAFTHNAVISGWGQTGPNTTGTRDLLFGTVLTIDPNARCQVNYPSDPITDTMVCATSTVADTCYGDSGGPLIMRTPDKMEYVEGITSWAAGQCGQGIPSVYSRVSTFSQWIKDVTGIAVGSRSRQ